jgi:NAD(P)-dependent dehydrogenase (short-subunit alcohol dehydrogenase family)
MRALRDTRVVITGGNTGIGRATAIELARMGASVTITSRSPERGQAAVDVIRDEAGADTVDMVVLDLASLDSVRAGAALLLADPRPIHVLVNNAGLAAFGRRQTTADGLERQFGVNHVGHFLLTTLLLDRIRASAPARIINVSSLAYGLVPEGMRWDDLQWEQEYDGWKAYGQSKLANLYFTWELAERVRDAGITVNALHPGFVSTELGRRRPDDRPASPAGQGPAAPARGATTVDISALGPAASPDDGARTSVFLATATSVAGISGAYFDEHQHQVDLHGVAADRESARRLWTITESIIGSQ